MGQYIMLFVLSELNSITVALTSKIIGLQFSFGKQTNILYNCPSATITPVHHWEDDWK